MRYLWPSATGLPVAGSRSAFDEWLGGWRIVTFPVVDFQESPRLLSSLQSFISFQTGCKERWNLAACGSWCSRAGADRGLDGLDGRQMHAPLPGLEGGPCLTSSGSSFRVLKFFQPPIYPSFLPPLPFFFEGGRGGNLKNPGKIYFFKRKLQEIDSVECKLTFLRGNLETSID